MRAILPRHLVAGFALCAVITLNANARDNGIPPTRFQPPLSETFVTQGFGVYLGEYEGVSYQGHHPGLDFRARPGTKVHAIAAGQVLRVGQLFEDPEDGGWYVEIAHAQAGIRSMYLHVAKPLVEAGQSVGKGQVIAHIMLPKRVPPHLHLEIKCLNFDILNATGVRVNFVGPQTLPAGRYGYVQNRAELNAGWLNPALFIGQNSSAKRVQSALRTCPS